MTVVQGSADALTTLARTHDQVPSEGMGEEKFVKKVDSSRTVFSFKTVQARFFSFWWDIDIEHGFEMILMKYLGHQHDHLAYAHTYIDSKTGRPGVTPKPPPKTSERPVSYAFASRKGLAAVHLGNLAVSKPAVAPKDMEKILLRAFVEAADVSAGWARIVFQQRGVGQHGNMSLGIFFRYCEEVCSVVIWCHPSHSAGNPLGHIPLQPAFSFRGASATRAESHAGGTTANAAQSADPFKPEGPGDGDISACWL